MRVGARDEPITGLFHVGLIKQYLLDFVVADRAVQPVRANQDHVAAMERDLREHDLHLFLDAQRLQDDVRMLEAFGLFQGHGSSFDELPGQGLVFGCLAQATAAQDVAARIADLSDQQCGVDQSNRRAGRAHSALVLVVARLDEDTVVGRFDRAAQATRKTFARQRSTATDHRRDGFDGHGGGDLTRGGTTHAVAYQEQSPLLVQRKVERDLG